MKHDTAWDKFCRWLAYKLPRQVVWHAYIRLHGHATSSPPWSARHPSECPWDEALKARELQS